jgi:hypothetical protein
MRVYFILLQDSRESVHQALKGISKTKTKK